MIFSLSLSHCCADWLIIIITHHINALEDQAKRKKSRRSPFSPPVFFYKLINSFHLFIGLKVNNQWQTDKRCSTWEYWRSDMASDNYQRFIDKLILERKHVNVLMMIRFSSDRSSKYSMWPASKICLLEITIAVWYVS